VLDPNKVTMIVSSSVAFNNAFYKVAQALAVLLLCFALTAPLARAVRLVPLDKHVNSVMAPDAPPAVFLDSPERSVIQRWLMSIQTKARDFTQFKSIVGGAAIDEQLFWRLLPDDQQKPLAVSFTNQNDAPVPPSDSKDHQGHIIPQNLLRDMANCMWQFLTATQKDVSDPILQSIASLVDVLWFGPETPLAPSYLRPTPATKGKPAADPDFSDGDRMRDFVGLVNSIILWNPANICRAPKDPIRGDYPLDSVDNEVLEHLAQLSASKVKGWSKAFELQPSLLMQANQAISSFTKLVGGPHDLQWKKDSNKRKAALQHMREFLNSWKRLLENFAIDLKTRRDNITTGWYRFAWKWVGSRTSKVGTRTNSRSLVKLAVPAEPSKF